MHPRHFLAAAAALATSTKAQSWENDMATDITRRPVSASLMNITFSSAESQNCGNDSSNALTIAIRTIPQDRVCFNLGNTFSDPTATYSMRGLDCKDNTICGSDWVYAN
ncbi:hypothetical protein CKM354_000153900 [Cercospora kikuchii]|uniref:Uncharacterized protein n=1 Tax=Cercospora kikuchii TaxID=84275 RepID=A0A9P3F8D0_9PEZI|nr:uncharacterized protein CKM354_000153900 [Cercospora kikuchii]GIZ38116.1 hypothetical protein CKM354_000153900 [Cercospora kikuchii]